MFDVGFAELIIIAIVGLLVIGPERLPGAIRTGSAWLNRLRRGFNDIKREVQQEMHNDAIMHELRKTGEDLKSGADSLKQELDVSTRDLSDSTPAAGESPTGPTDKNSP